MELAGKCALVTGSTKGIGLAIAEALHREGAHLVISSRNQDEINQTVSALSDGRASVTGKRCDVGQADEFRALVEHCVSELGGLDILINNAGIGIFRRVEEMTSEFRDTVFNQGTEFICPANVTAFPGYSCLAV